MKILIICIIFEVITVYLVAAKSINKRDCCSTICSTSCNSGYSNCNSRPCNSGNSNCNSRPCNSGHSDCNSGSCNNSPNCDQKNKPCSNNSKEDPIPEEILPVLVPIPQNPSALPIISPATVNNTNVNNSTLEFTMTNSINTVNNISVPISINSTNQNSIVIHLEKTKEYDQVDQSIEEIEQPQCCYVIGKKCDANNLCTTERRKECSDICKGILPEVNSPQSINQSTISRDPIQSIINKTTVYQPTEDFNRRFYQQPPLLRFPISPYPLQQFPFQPLPSVIQSPCSINSGSLCSQSPPAQFVSPFSIQPPNQALFPNSVQPPNQPLFPNSVQPPNQPLFPNSVQPPNQPLFPNSVQPPNQPLFPTSVQPPNQPLFPTSVQPPNQALFPNSIQPLSPISTRSQVQPQPQILIQQQSPSPVFPQTIQPSVASNATVYQPPVNYFGPFYQPTANQQSPSVPSPVIQSQCSINPGSQCSQFQPPVQSLYPISFQPQVQPQPQFFMQQQQQPQQAFIEPSMQPTVNNCGRQAQQTVQQLLFPNYPISPCGQLNLQSPLGLPVPVDQSKSNFNGYYPRPPCSYQNPPLNRLSDIYFKCSIPDINQVPLYQQTVPIQHDVTRESQQQLENQSAFLRSVLLSLQQQQEKQPFMQNH